MANQNVTASSLPPRPRKIVGVRLAALTETVVLLAILLGICFLLGRSDRFIEVSPHPFWAVVLLITVQYGSLEGIAAALLATLALYLWNMPPQHYNETLFDYQLRLATTPFLWFVAAFVLGEIRLRVEQQKVRLQNQLDDLTEQATTVQSAFLQLKTTKEQQDRQLASQRKTVASIYKTFKYLESLSPSQILMDLDKIFSMALAPKKFSVYAVGPNGFEVVTSHGWQTNDHYLRRITPDTPLFKAIADERRLVTIVDRADEALLAGQGILAAPLFDPESNLLLGMVKVEDVDFLEFNVSTLEAFKALCETIGLAYSHARRFRSLQRQALYSDVKGVYSEIFLKEQRQYFERLAHAHQESLSALIVQTTDHQVQPGLEEALAKVIDSVVHPFGQVCKAGRDPLHFMVLLPRIDTEQAKNMTTRLLEAVQHDPSLAHLKLTLKVESLAQTSQPVDVAKP